MKCAICNYESLNLNAKFCSHCGNRMIYEKRFCSNCGNKIIRKVNFCSKCGNKINYNYIDNDSEKNIFAKEKIEEETKELKKVEQNNNGGDSVNMENNIIKESYLEVLPNQEIIKKDELNILPTIKSDTNLLLPVIIQKKELALIEIKKEFNNLKEHKSAVKILKVAKALAKALSKFVRFCFIASASVIGFVGVSVLIVMSTAIITKNIVNSYYGTTPQKDTTYSIFQMKDDSSKGMNKDNFERE